MSYKYYWEYLFIKTCNVYESSICISCMPYDKENIEWKEMCQDMCWYMDVQSHKLNAAHWNIKLSRDILDKKKTSFDCHGFNVHLTSRHEVAIKHQHKYTTRRRILRMR